MNNKAFRSRSGRILSLPLRGKVSTNGRRMRGQRFILMSDSVGLCVYRELRKSLTLFVYMIFGISKPLIRLGIRRATFPPRGRLSSDSSTSHRVRKRRTRPEIIHFFFFFLQSSVPKKSPGRIRGTANAVLIDDDRGAGGDTVIDVLHRVVRRVDASVGAVAHIDRVAEG